MKQRGDTIIEVLFSMMIVSLVLATSYAIASRALHTMRFAQEQTEAVKLAEGQIEKLKYLVSKPPVSPLIFAPPTPPAATAAPYCIKDDLTIVPYTSVSSNPGYSDCNDINLFYNQKITYKSNNLFEIEVNWVRQSSSEPGIIKMFYRLYQ